MTTTKKTDATTSDESSEFMDTVIENAKVGLSILAHGFLFGVGGWAATRVLTNKFDYNGPSIANKSENVIEFGKSAKL